MRAPLTPEMIEFAYRRGAFPMADPATGAIDWYRPRRRAVIPLDQFHVSRSLARRIRKADFRVTFDQDFAAVMRACAGRDETWISEDFHRAYGELHRLGKAHSVEVWLEDRLAGGIYGVHLGAAFFAESKFHRVTDMSKVALASLAGRLRERGFTLLEVQYLTPHLAQFGAVEIPGRVYEARLADALSRTADF